jgi:iron complex outermembrane receptor protein
MSKPTKTTTTSRGLLLGSAALGLMAFASGAFAQAPAEEGAVEQIIVTGSSIRGVAPVGSALIGVTKDTIALQAPANTKELLSNIPQLGNFGANAEQSTSNRFRTAGFQPNIHNLGIYATLTLINGHRIAPTGGEAVFPDPSIIPVSALQRVELIADGASSVYGSDAVAGVVNFIYRKPFNGVEMQATYGGFNDTRYEKRNIAIVASKKTDRFGVLAAYEYSDNKSPLNTEIPVIARGGDQTSVGGATCAPPSACSRASARSMLTAAPPARLTSIRP